MSTKNEMVSYKLDGRCIELHEESNSFTMYITLCRTSTAAHDVHFWQIYARLTA